MKLYYSPGACSLAPHILLHEAGLPADLVKVDLKVKKTEKGEDFTKINPKGYVPTVQLDNGQVMTEVAVLLQYIADQKPDAKLVPPAGTLDRYRAQEWLNFVSSEIHKGFSPLWNPAVPEAYRAIALERLNLRLALLDRHLATNEYLLGKNFSAADAYLFTVTNWAKPLNVDLSGYKNLIAFRERVGKRPAVQAALKAEGLA
ncbi:glutathione S-transferase [Hypericibacter adhaerens]|uniref:Glutathione S-transferase n=1 Tax=Hypericibacter adhaerens TaxID=2602016 RepID=A0A5J6MUE6_9PROT|nr:glutathione transferase GstA [Hypericibacter adhaerens]QEX21019.1 glutathione S-transferase [Hypericibacter adhaerens]HVY52269.1 glutathione transferase GstA [Devosia sp.]